MGRILRMLWADRCCCIISDGRTNDPGLHRSRLHRVQVGVCTWGAIRFPLLRKQHFSRLQNFDRMRMMCPRGLVSEVPELRPWLRFARVIDGKGLLYRRLESNS